MKAGCFVYIRHSLKICQFAPKRHVCRIQTLFQKRQIQFFTQETVSCVFFLDINFSLFHGQFDCNIDLLCEENNTRFINYTKIKVKALDWNVPSPCFPQFTLSVPSPRLLLFKFERLRHRKHMHKHILSINT